MFISCASSNKQPPQWRPLRSRGFLPLIFFLIPLLISPPACIRNPATREVHAKLLSKEAERKIGEETKKNILQEYQVLESTTISKYVSDLGQKIAHVSDRPTVDYDFTVLDSDLINAFAAPGGFIFVTRGLLENVDDEAELAMVLGHEIAHVTALHGVQMIQKEMGQNALSLLGTIGAAIAIGPEAMLMMANTANLFSSLYLLGYSREKELEADNLGLQYMLRAGYDPQAALRFLKVLEREGEENLGGWDLYFRTHPKTTDRIRIIESMIGPKLSEDKRVGKTDFQEIKKHLPKTDQSEIGVIDGNTYTNAIHHVLLTVPENWTLGRFHPQSLVSFQTLNHKGEGRLQAVHLSSATTNGFELAYRYAKAHGFREVSGRNVLYQAGYGYLGRYQGISPRGEFLEIRLFATIRRGMGYVLMVGAPFEKADQYVLDLEKILRDFQFKI